MLKKKASKKASGLKVRIQPVIEPRTAVRIAEIAQRNSWDIGTTLDYLCAISEDFEKFKRDRISGSDLFECVANLVSAETETIEVLNLRK